MELGKEDVKQKNYRPEDIYEPEMAVEDDPDINMDMKIEVKHQKQVSYVVPLIIESLHFFLRISSCVVLDLKAFL